MRTEYSYAEAVALEKAQVESFIFSVITTLRDSAPGSQTYEGSGDTFIHGIKQADGSVWLTDCKVRRTMVNR